MAPVPGGDFNAGSLAQSAYCKYPSLAGVQAWFDGRFALDNDGWAQFPNPTYSEGRPTRLEQIYLDLLPLAMYM